MGDAVSATGRAERPDGFSGTSVMASTMTMQKKTDIWRIRGAPKHQPRD